MEQLTASEKITLSIILNLQKKKDAETLAMWERIHKESEGEEKAGAFGAIVYYQNELKELDAIIKKVEGVKI